MAHLSRLSLLLAGILTAHGLMGQAPVIDPKAAEPKADQAKVTPKAPVADPVATRDGVKVWIMREGDSLALIAARTNIPLASLQTWNPPQHKATPFWVGDAIRLEAPAAVSQPPSEGAKGEPTGKPAEASVEKSAEKPQEKAKAVKPAPEPPQAEAPKAPAEPVLPPAPKKVRQQAPREVKGFREAADDLVVVRELRDVKEVVYNPDAVPLINCGPYIVTSIYLPDREKIVASTCGDTTNWDLTPLEGRNAFYLKPKAAGEAYETNLVIICESGNVYNLALTADPSKRPLKTLRILPPPGAVFGQDEDPGIVFEPGQKVTGTQGGVSGLAGLNRHASANAAKGGLSPADIQALMDARAAEERGRLERMQDEFMAAMLTQRQDDFQISYPWNCPFRVLNIFTASGVTYVRIEVPENAAPLLWLIDESGKKAAVNMTPLAKVPGAYVIDRIFREAVIAVGKKEARVRNMVIERQIKNLKKAS